MTSDPSLGPAEFVPIAEEAIATFEELGDTHGLAAAESLLGQALGRAGRTEESFAALERAIAHAERAGDQVVRRATVAQLAMRLCEGPTPVPEALHRLDELRSRVADDPLLDAGISRCQALALAMAGRFDESEELFRASGEILDLGVPTLLTVAGQRYVAEAKYYAGDLASAKDDVRAAFLPMRDARGAGSDARALRAAAELAMLCCDQGEWDEAAEYLAYGQEVDEDDPPEGKVYAIFRLAARARLAAVRGEHAEAVELGRRATKLAERARCLNYGARAWLALAEVHRADGDPGEADAAVVEALRLYEAKGNIAAVARVKKD
jgi:tetratricopeptide (TPR) repeat protein